MASDGFWRWGEHVFGTDDWRTFAMANQKLRRVETKLGDFLFNGGDVDHFVTLVEQTGNPMLERAIVAHTWRHDGHYLIRLFNGNTDWPIYVRLRMPRVAGEGPWRLRDALSGADFVRAAKATWDRAALSAGVVVPVPGRGELFLLLEPAPADFSPDRFRSVLSLEMNMHAPRDHGWYHTGTGSPRWVNKLFAGVSFSPDGRHVLYCSNQDDRQFRLYTVTTDTGEPQPVASAGMSWPVETAWGAR